MSLCFHRYKRRTLFRSAGKRFRTSTGESALCRVEERREECKPNNSQRMPRRRRTKKVTRYFICAKCECRWWAKVSKHNAVSQCRKCQTENDAVPSHQEPKLGRHVCACGNTFIGWTSEGVKSPCYACGRNILPEELIRPRRIRRKTGNTHNCNTCNGKGNCPNVG